MTYMPQFDDYTLQQKQREISAQQAREDQELRENPQARLSRIYQRLKPHARQLCRGNDELVSCWDWSIKVDESDVVNAYATGNNEVFFTLGFLKKFRSDDEIAFVLAHEIAHHILNHQLEDLVNSAVSGVGGMLVGGLVTAVVAGALGASDESLEEWIEIGMEAGMEVGAERGRLTYSVDQEAEADQLALTMVERAGYRTSEARAILLFIGKSDNKKRSQNLASHPSGPERIAAFDYRLQQLRGMQVANVQPSSMKTESATRNNRQPSHSFKRDAYCAGVVSDQKIRCLTAEAESGNTKSQYLLAVNYLYGLDVVQDPVKAYIWAFVSNQTKEQEVLDLTNIRNQLSESQLFYAKSLAEQCLKSRYKNCSELNR